MECEACGATLVRWRDIVAMGPEEWAQRKTEGCRRMCTKTSCNPCQKRGGRPRSSWPLALFIEEAEFLMEQGLGHHEVAQKLGVQRNTLSRNFDRAHRRGLTTRRIPYQTWRSS